MSLTKTFEDNEVGPEVERFFADIRAGFDLPFVPTPFRVLAGIPEYLRLMWRDMGHVAASREFRSGSALFSARANSRSFAPPPQQANRGLVGDPGCAQANISKNSFSAAHSSKLEA
jgi:hypothetical protein